MSTKKPDSPARRRPLRLCGFASYFFFTLAKTQSLVRPPRWILFSSRKEIVVVM
jgi:hypothetical protein